MFIKAFDPDGDHDFGWIARTKYDFDDFCDWCDEHNIKYHYERTHWYDNVDYYADFFIDEE